MKQLLCLLSFIAYASADIGLKLHNQYLPPSANGYHYQKPIGSHQSPQQTLHHPSTSLEVPPVLSLNLPPLLGLGSPPPAGGSSGGVQRPPLINVGPSSSPGSVVDLNYSPILGGGSSSSHGSSGGYYRPPLIHVGSSSSPGSVVDLNLSPILGGGSSSSHGSSGGYYQPPLIHVGSSSSPGSLVDLNLGPILGGGGGGGGSHGGSNYGGSSHGGSSYGGSSYGGSSHGGSSYGGSNHGGGGGGGWPSHGSPGGYYRPPLINVGSASSQGSLVDLNLSPILGGGSSSSSSSSSFAPGHSHYGPNCYHQHEYPRPYQFGYSVNDPQTANHQSHHSASDGEVTRGEYRVLLPDGRTQIVKYSADAKNGYNAEVLYENTPQYPPLAPIHSIHPVPSYGFDGSNHHGYYQ